MQEPAFPADEAQRLGALRALGILDTPAEERFDRITRVAQRLFEVPITLVSLVDANRQWFKSCQGLGARETPRSISFCGHAILGDTTLVVPDALADPRFADNPLVTGEPHIRFYAGHPLHVADGSRIGTLCIIDRQPRAFAPERLALLADLAAMVERELNQQTLSEAVASAQASHLALQKSQSQLQDIVASSPTVTYTLEIDANGARATWVSPNLQRFLGFDAAASLLQPDWWIEQVHPADRAAAGQAVAQLLDKGHIVHRYRIRNRAGQYIWVSDEMQLMPGEGGAYKAIGSWSDVSEQHASAQLLERARGLLEAIRRVQSGHIGRASAQLVFDELLATLLEFGESEYGFIGEVLQRADGSPYLKTHAITNIAWDAGTRRFYAENAPGGMEFGNLKTLFGAVLVTAEPVIANEPASDPRRGGLPPGHPPLKAFLGLPIKVGGHMVGMIGIANRAGGYDRQVIDFLEPLLSTIGQLIEARRAQVGYQEAQERAERLALVASKTTNGVVITDAAGRVQWINEGFSRITGYTLSEMQGRKPGDVLQGAATDAAAVARMRQALLQVESCDVDLVNYTRDGRPYWINIRLDPLRDDAGQLQGFLAIETDISERKQTETALTESARHTQAILDHVIDGIVTIDEFGVVATFNRAAEQMFGYPAAEVVGRNVNMLMPEPYHSEHDGYLRRYRETGVARIIGSGREAQGRRRNGESFPMELSVSAFSREGQAMYIGLVRDLTERKKIERMKSEFVSTVSHELRTPLTSIKGSLGLLAGGVAGELTPQARGLIDIAYKNSERLVGLINDLLDMEKIESGKMRFDLSPVRLMELVEQCVQANQGYAQQYGVRLEIVARLAADAAVLVDEARLAQALSNLLSNAAKFSPAGSVVEVGVTQEAGQLRLSVTDHGPGIAEEFKARIFQKFSQADSSDTRQKGGTGLGLSITKALVEQMDGQIGFDSRPGAGSTFWLTFPCWQGEPARLPTTQQQPAPRVLVCEDDPDMATLLSLLLAQAGYETEIAHDAETAKVMLARQSYAALTLDLKLPGQSGVALIQELRADPATAALPIVVVSGWEGKTEWSAELGVADWLDKPVQRQRLLQALSQAVHRPGTQRARILHVEDDPDLRQVMAALLQEVADYDCAASVAQAQAKLDDQAYDLLILDLDLPDQSGWRVLEFLRRSRSNPPVLVFTGHELSEADAARVGAVRVKSRTSNAELLQTIGSLVLRAEVGGKNEEKGKT